MAHGDRRTRASTRRARRANRRRRREGAVMLVVMLVLMVATASAAVSVNTVQSEIQAAGHDRIAVQTRYVSETAIMTTLAWMDQLAVSKQLEEIWLPAPPPMAVYGEPDLPAVVAGVTPPLWSRATMGQQDVLETQLTDVTPVTEPGVPAADLTGSFGPRVTYTVPQPDGYVVDINDCMVAPADAVPGAPVVGSSGSAERPVQFYCTVTARGRVTRDADTLGERDAHERRWTFGGAVYDQNMYDSAHDSRAVVITPPMVVSMDR